MSFVLTIIWIFGISSFTLLGSWYARRFERLDLLVALYVTFVLVAQVLAVKISAFDLWFATFFGPSGVLVFSLTYLLTDIVNEKFGRAETHRMIFIAFVSQVAMVFFFWLGVKFPAAPFWTMQNEWAHIFGVVPRITLASWAAFLVSENFDAYTFAWFRRATDGRHLWMRNAFSSLPALFLDTIIFIPLAFAGVGMPLAPLIIGQTSVKWLVGLLNIPFMYLNRWVFSKTL